MFEPNENVINEGETNTLDIENPVWGDWLDNVRS